MKKIFVSSSLRIEVYFIATGIMSDTRRAQCALQTEQMQVLPTHTDAVKACVAQDDSDNPQDDSLEVHVKDYAIRMSISDSPSHTVNVFLNPEDTRQSLLMNEQFVNRRLLTAVANSLLPESKHFDTMTLDFVITADALPGNIYPYDFLGLQNNRIVALQKDGVTIVSFVRKLLLEDPDIDDVITECELDKSLLQLCVNFTKDIETKEVQVILGECSRYSPHRESKFIVPIDTQQFSDGHLKYKQIFKK